MKGINLVFTCMICLMVGTSYGQFYTNGANIVYTTDKVGIGTSNPNSKLSFGTSTNSRIIGLWDSPTNFYGLGIEDYQMRLQVGNTSSRFSFMAGENSEVLTVQGNGRVGIGSPNPNSKLSFGTSTNSRIIGLWDSPTNFYGLGIEDYQMRLQVGNTSSRFSFMAGDNSEVFTVQGNGNVGIATTSPDYRLDVNGIARAKEIRVEIGWSDYVFLPSYQLPTLQEEEHHIQQNGHLIGFESEAAMEGEIQLGDVTKRQQAKIEEMMLHIIEMDKKLEEQKQEIRAFKLRKPSKR